MAVSKPLQAGKLRLAGYAARKQALRGFEIQLATLSGFTQNVADIEAQYGHFQEIYADEIAVINQIACGLIELGELPMSFWPLLMECHIDTPHVYQVHNAVVLPNRYSR